MFASPLFLVLVSTISIIENQSLPLTAQLEQIFADHEEDIAPFLQELAATHLDTETLERELVDNQLGLEQASQSSSGLGFFIDVHSTSENFLRHVRGC